MERISSQQADGSAGGSVCPWRQAGSVANGATQHPAPAEASDIPFWGSVAWALAFIALLGWHAILTLGLFGDSLSLDGVLDNQPVLSGFHPQHQYLGHLGAQSLADHWRSCVYDPAFQAGYPKTPVFNGSRLAEVFMLAGGGGFQPAAYKIGLALVCMLVPILLIVAGSALELGALSTFLGTLGGMLLFWGPHGRQAVEAGDLDVALASLALLAHFGLLVRFHRAPGFLVWLGLLLTACLGWFLQPMLFPIALPLLLVYYLTVGIRHGSLTWHLSLAAAELIALGLNLFWLIDWFLFWWVRSPLPMGEGMLRHRTFQTIWEAPIWSGAIERGLAAALFLSGLLGCLILNQTQRRPAARLLALGAGGLLVLAILGISWEPLGQLGTSGMLLPGLWFACLPAAYGWTWAVAQLSAGGRAGRLILGCLVAGLVILGAIEYEGLERVAGRMTASKPLHVGLSAERQMLLDQLKVHTTAEGRILWEDRQRPRQQSRWAALLPLLTGRAFLGGLDSEATIEHSSIGLREGHLAGRPISTWSDEHLEEYCKRYNVAWIACWCKSTVEHLSQWEGAEKVIPLSDAGKGWLFAVKDAPLSFALKGKAEVIQADSKHITLSDVEPDQGVVVLSMHYQSGMRATPSRVQVEREPCVKGRDPIGFVRLRVAGPVARMTLTWEGR